MTNDNSKLGIMKDQLEKTVTKYKDVFWLRALVSAIPNIGSSIDILLSAKGEAVVSKDLKPYS